MRRFAVRLLPLVLALLVCGNAAEAQKKARGDRTKITRADLNEAGGTAQTAIDAIRLLQPHWLNPPMGRMAPAAVDPLVNPMTRNAVEPVVYIDEMRQPTIDVLRSVKTELIIEMKYLDQNRAIQMLGPGHEAGAIQVTTVNKKS
ncbi:MAG: hypothetical protein AAB224_09730 [Gemmatimonadota bacterium]